MMLPRISDKFRTVVGTVRSPEDVFCLLGVVICAGCDNALRHDRGPLTVL
jgi:hypothetical protein